MTLGFINDVWQSENTVNFANNFFINVVIGTSSVGFPFVDLSDDIKKQFVSDFNKFKQELLYSFCLVEKRKSEYKFVRLHRICDEELIVEAMRKRILVQNQTEFVKEFDEICKSDLTGDVSYNHAPSYQ